MLGVAIAAPTVPSALSSTEQRYSAPALWHLFSLDAPTVAALWTIFFARAMHISLPWIAPAALGAGVWVLYVLDRILDGVRVAQNPLQASALRERHYFHARHRKPFLIGVLCILPTTLWLGFRYSLFSVRRDMLLLSLFVAAYVLVVHGLGEQAQRWLPKELAVGVIFAVATAIPTGARMPAESTPLILGAILFAALCWLNCVAIHHWEELHSGHRQCKEHCTTRWAGNHLVLASSLLAICAFGMLLMPAARAGTQTIALACMVSALLFVALEKTSHRVPALTLRIAADAALLTPLLLLPFL
ncbi:MAG: hypothetical protein ACYC46_07535 [Acidobacteriaceae bacterium]